MTAKGYWSAFAIGVAAGACSALLYAPQTGVRARRQLRNKFGNAGDRLNDAGDYLRRQSESLSREAQAAAARMGGHVAGDVDAATGAVGSTGRQRKSLV